MVPEGKQWFCDHIHGRPSQILPRIIALLFSICKSYALLLITITMFIKIFICCFSSNNSQFIKVLFKNMFIKKIVAHVASVTIHPCEAGGRLAWHFDAISLDFIYHNF